MDKCKCGNLLSLIEEDSKGKRLECICGNKYVLINNTLIQTNIKVTQKQIDWAKEIINK